MPKAKTEADYYALAEGRGFEWLGSMPNTTKDKTWWQCPKGHKWPATYNNVRHNRSGCPACANKAPIQPYHYKLLARKRGFRWLGPEVKTTKEPTWWECGHGHRWPGRYNDIQQGHGCQICYGNKPLTAKDFQTLARKRNFKWLGPLENNCIKTWWLCEHGHRWPARYDNIQQGHGCPVCYKNKR